MSQPPESSCSRTLRSRRVNQPSTVVETNDSESSSDSDDNEVDNDYKQENQGVVRTRRKRKSDGLTTVPCKLSKSSVSCCLHIDDRSREDPKSISSETLAKLSEVSTFLSPLSDEELEFLGPQSKLIRNKLKIIPDMNDSKLKACKACQKAVKKNFKRYEKKLKTFENNENAEPDNVISTPVDSSKPQLRSSHVSTSKKRTAYSSSASRTGTPESTRLLPQDKCFICNKSKVYHNKKHHTRLSKVEITDRRMETQLKLQATLKRDSMMLAKLEAYDILAREARYHKVCYDNYRHRHDLKKEGIKEKGSVDDAFTELREYVDCHVFGNSEIVTMDVLADIYGKIIWGDSAESLDRSNVRKETKRKLLEFYNESLSFEAHPVDGDICFDSRLTPGQLALKIYHHRKTPNEIVREAGLLVRNEVQQFFKKIDDPPYPPQIKDLARYTVPNDSLLITMSSHVLAGKDFGTSSHSKQVKIRSMSEDFAYGVTNGKFKTPKHTALAAFIRQHTRSKKVITMLNKLNHCISNDEMLSIETDWARSMRAMEHDVPRDIVKGIPVAQGMDNFDLKQYTETGEGTDHVTQSLALQLIPKDGTYETQPIPEVTKSKRRSFPPSATHSTTFKINKKQESSYTIDAENVKHCSLVPSHHLFDLFICEMAAFKSGGSSEWLAPSYSGWTALQFKNLYENLRVVIGYYPPYLKPITDAASIDAKLRSFKACSEYVGQTYTIVFADMDVVIRSQKILWSKPDYYQNKVIIVPGMMHTEMDLLGAVGMMVDGSGFNDILETARVIKKGSLKGVLSGRNITRSRECHRVFKTALSRQLIGLWIESLDPIADADIIQAVRNVKVILRRFSVTEIEQASTQSDFNDLHENSDLKLLYEKFKEFKAKVRQEKIAGETGVFWLNYIEIMNEIEILRRCVHLHDRYGLLQSLQNLSFLFFMYNKHNYARWITQYIYEQLNVDTLWPGARDLLDKCGISSKRKSNSSLLTANDMLLEATINNESGRGQGCNFRGFGNIDGGSERIHLTRSFRVEMNDWLEDFVTQTDSSGNKAVITHEEIKPRKISRRERKIRRVMDLMDEMCPAFSFSNPPELFCLSTGSSTSREAATSLLQCSMKDNKMFVKRYNEVYIQKTKNFYNPINQNPYVTFVQKSRVYKLKGKSAEQRLIDQRNVLGSISLLAQKEGYDMKELLQYPFTELPPQISTQEGTPLTNTKSSLVNHLIKEVDTDRKINPDTSGLIVDAQYFIHSFAKEFSSPESGLKTYGDVGEYLYTQLLHLGNYPVVYFVTETYRNNSVKKFERLDRGSSNVLVGGVGLGSLRPMGTSWNAAMHDNKFKSTLQQLILEQFKSDMHALSLKGRKLYYTLDNECFLLECSSSNKTICNVQDELYCDHEEPDTKVIYYSSQMPLGLDTVVIKIADTDVVINAIHHSSNVAPEILILWGTKEHRKIFSARDIRENIGEDMSQALVGLHVFTGNGKVSAISGLGKVNPFKKVAKSTILQKAFTDLGATGN